MNRRELIKGMMAASAVMTLPRFVFAEQGPEHIYLHEGERLSGVTFTQDVTIHAAHRSVVEDCVFTNCSSSAIVGEGVSDVIIRNNIILPNESSSVDGANLRERNGRKVVWEQRPEGVRWRYAA